MAEFYAVVNDLIGGYDVSQWDKPVSEHDTRPVKKGGKAEWTIASFISQEWAERIADLLNNECPIVNNIEGMGIDYDRLKTALDSEDHWGKMVHAFEFVTVLSAVEVYMKDGHKHEKKSS